MHDIAPTDIMMVVESYPQVSETFIRDQAQYLGCKVLVFRSNSQTSSREEKIFRLTEVSGFVKARHAIAAKARRIFLGRYPMLELARSQRKELFLLLSKHKPRVVLAQFGGVGIEVRDACKRLGIPFVIHFHGLDASKMLRFERYKRALKQTFTEAAACVVVSKVQGERLMSLAGRSSLIFNLIPYGVARMPCTQRSIGETGEFLWLAVGRMVEKKSPLELIRAFAKTYAACPKGADQLSPKLVIVGDGPLLAETTRLAEKLNCLAAVEFLGAQPREKVRELLLSANGFLQHSVTAADGDEEGWPNSIAEAAASGLPIVATRHASIPEQLVDGESGYLVDEHDVDAFSKAMLVVMRKPEAAKELGRKARDRMQSLFRREDQVDALEKVLTQVACTTKPAKI